MDDNLGPKASYRALDQLINHEWKTSLEMRTDARGVVQFRGFLGNYRVLVVTPDGKQRFNTKLSADAEARHRLVLH